MKLVPYLRLIKFRYHISFSVVILGALMFNSEPSYLLIKPLLITYLSFNVLMYGGLYTVNDVSDIEADKLHPVKKNRPLPSGHISKTSALIFAFSIIIAGLAIAYFYFGENIFLLYLLFILVNQLYTHVAKKIPYLEGLFNSLTYPMRLLLGILLVTKAVPWVFFIAIMSIACGMAFLRRTVERKYPGWQARKVLKYYSETKLLLIQIAMLIFIITASAIDYPNYAFWYVVVVVSYLIFLIGIYFSSRFLNFCHWLWLN